MKKILFCLFIFNFSISWSQFSIEEEEMMEIVKNNGANIPTTVFLDTTIVKNMKLANATNWRHIWFDIEDSIKSIKQFYDIRLKFDSNKDAVKFNKKYMGINSEFAPRIKKHNLNFEGANSFYVFAGSSSYTKMMEPYGYQSFCFLFVVDNYFVKIYVTCLKEYTPDKFQNFVSEAIKRVKKAQK